MEQEKINEQEPTISDSEMKMPEEHFGVTAGKSKDTTHLGIILGILIVLLVLILGGLYLWGTTLQNIPEIQEVQRPADEENNEPESTTAEAQVQALETVSTSNEIDAIEADIESTNLDELDAELEAIDAEMEASEESR
jgi:uncharacterized protein HemX